MLATLCLQANHSVTNKRFKFHYVLILLVWGFSVCLFGGFLVVFFCLSVFMKSSTWANTCIFHVLNFADS